MTNTTVIRATGLRVSYGSFEAVRGVDLTVRRGEIYALLGTNGAGKTSTLETLEGHRAPSAGTVEVLGGDPADRKRIRPRMGVMLQETGFAGELTTIEMIELVGKLSGRSDDPKRLLEAVGLADKARTRLDQLSGGQKRRVDFVMAIYGTPELVFLDEPTTGLDPSAREALWEVVQDVRRAGSTVVLTTHYLEEAERHADRIGLMHDGVLQREGTLAELVEAHPSRIRFARFDGVEALPLAHRVDDDLVTIETAELQDDLAALLGWAAARGVRLDRLSATSSSLEDVFHTLGAAQPAHA